ncbi:MAG: TetR/AcrR family transcriptional regulator [Sulfitobacter sp.]|tara:strand:+ start:13362 stop:13976 length:615 start_codon:yes stop_codon:yes gene_type:complete
MSNEQWSDVVDSRDVQRSKKRKAVVEAGARLFNENGFEKTSLDDLAKSLGITKRTIYYYVQSKDEILMEAIRQSMWFLEKMVGVAESKPRSAVEKIEVVIEEYAKWITTDFGACLVLTRENMLTDDVQLELRSRKNRLDWLVRDAIIEGIRSGEIREGCDPRLTSAAIFGALNWVPFWNRSAKITPASEIATNFKNTFVQGLLS